MAARRVRAAPEGPGVEGREAGKQEAAPRAPAPPQLARPFESAAAPLAPCRCPRCSIAPAAASPPQPHRPRSQAPAPGAPGAAVAAAAGPPLPLGRACGRSGSGQGRAAPVTVTCASVPLPGPRRLGLAGVVPARPRPPRRGCGRGPGGTARLWAAVGPAGERRRRRNPRAGGQQLPPAAGTEGLALRWGGDQPRSPQQPGASVHSGVRVSPAGSVCHPRGGARPRCARERRAVSGRPRLARKSCETPGGYRGGGAERPAFCGRQGGERGKDASEHFHSGTKSESCGEFWSVGPCLPSCVSQAPLPLLCPASPSLCCCDFVCVCVGSGLDRSCSYRSPSSAGQGKQNITKSSRVGTRMGRSLPPLPPWANQT